MILSIYSPNEPFRPAPGHNNLWYEDRNKEQVIVFVHGILSDSHGCWYRDPTGTSPGVYWPDLLRKDKRFDQFSIFLGGYYTDVGSGPYEVSDCAEELMEALRRPDESTGRIVLKHKTIVFVCHSMGGIVVRYMLSARPWEFRDTRICLALIASPSQGSEWADRLKLLTGYFKNQQGIQLKFGNWSLRDLDERFRIILQDRGIPNLFDQSCKTNS